MSSSRSRRWRRCGDRRVEGEQFQLRNSPENKSNSPKRFSRFVLVLQVSCSRLRRPGSRDGEVCLAPQRLRLPPGCKEAEGQLRQRLSVCVEVWQDGWDELPHTWLRRLGTRQRKLPHTPQVGMASFPESCARCEPSVCKCASNTYTHLVWASNKLCLCFVSAAFLAARGQPLP